MFLFLSYFVLFSASFSSSSEFCPFACPDSMQSKPAIAASICTYVLVVFFFLGSVFAHPSFWYRLRIVWFSYIDSMDDCRIGYGAFWGGNGDYLASLALRGPLKGNFFSGLFRCL